MTVLELEVKLQSYNRFEEGVIGGIIQHIKDNYLNKTCILRLRQNGIDVFTDKYTLEQYQETLPHWNSDWLEINIEI